MNESIVPMLDPELMEDWLIVHGAAFWETDLRDFPASSRTGSVRQVIASLS